MKTYIRQEEINEIKEELRELNQKLKAAYIRLEEYQGMSEDHKTIRSLREEEERLFDALDDLKDCGKEAA